MHLRVEFAYPFWQHETSISIFLAAPSIAMSKNFA